MAAEPSPSVGTTPLRPTPGQEFDVVQEVEARTRAFLVKLIASSTTLVTLVAAGYGLITNRYGVVSGVWGLTGPILAGLIVYYFDLSHHLGRGELGAIRQRRSEASGQSEDAAAMHTPAQVELNFEHTIPRMPERRLNPFVWSIVAAFTAAAFTIAVGTLTPVRSAPLLLGLPFLAVLAIAMIGFLWFDQRVRRQALLRTGYAGLQETRALKLRSADLISKIDQRRESQRS